MTNVTAAARITDRMTAKYEPFAVCARTAMMLPGAAGARSAPPRSMFVVTPVAPPAMSARISIGFMSAYGKYTSWMPPKNWMTAAPGAEARAAPMPKNVNASSSPTPGPGLASRRNRIDDPVSAACWMPSGVSTPWLMALLRNSTFAGSMMMLVSGSRFIVDQPVDRVAEDLHESVDQEGDRVEARPRP